VAAKELTAALFVDGFLYGEGPRWHDGHLWFTDGPAGAVYVVDDDGGIHVAAETSNPSGLGWMPDGTMVISALQTARIDQVVDGKARVLHDVTDIAWSTNDMVVTVDGGIYVDLYVIAGEKMVGKIGYIPPGASIRVVSEAPELPNGMAIGTDRSTLLVADTVGQRILSFPIHPDGELAEPRVFAGLGEGRHPDGICVDTEGAVWVGCYDTGEFLRVLDGGRVTHRVSSGESWAVAPALGGAEGRTLFLIMNKTDHMGLVTGESVGRIECIDVDVPGLGWS
jgi:sugar lactone lactonase YvrE